MQRPSRSANRHDPFWDLDGAAARRSRTQRRFLRVGLVVFAVLFIAVVVARLPTFDPQLVTTNGSLRPVLAVALVLLLMSCVLVAAARLRTTAEG
jgi:heme/copper-type cytochrome/quinol oxidase subunit 3